MVLVRICGHWVRVFTDFPPDLIVSKSIRPTIDELQRAKHVFFDNGAFYYRMRRSIPPMTMLHEYYLQLKHYMKHLAGKVIYVVPPDTDNFEKNIRYWTSFQQNYRGFLTKLRNIADVKMVFVCHQFDKYLDFYLKNIDADVFALPARLISFSYGPRPVLRLTASEIEMIRQAINTIARQSRQVHLLGVSSKFINKIKCGIDWSKVQFDSLAYRHSLALTTLRPKMITSEDNKLLRFAAWIGRTWKLQ